MVGRVFTRVQEGLLVERTLSWKRVSIACLSPSMYDHVQGVLLHTEMASPLFNKDLSMWQAF